MSICLSAFSLCPLFKVCPSSIRADDQAKDIEEEEKKKAMLPTHRASVENDKKRFFKRKKETKKRKSDADLNE